MNARTFHPARTGLGLESYVLAEQDTDNWPDATLDAVVSLFPYPPERHIRMSDWVVLVALTSMKRAEDPISVAQRLASYVKSYRERFARTLPPTQLEKEPWPYG